MKRIIYILIFFIIIILGQRMVYASDLNLSGNNYILMEEKSGRVLLERNAHIKMPEASTTKIMTALLALEKGNLDDVVEITENSVNVEGSSIYLKVGEKLSLKDLLYGLMLRSGNDSAVAIANYIGNNEVEFVDLMNQKAVEIGANNTNFMNPHGLHDKNHYSTAYDLALITRKAFSYKEFEEVTKAKSYKGNRAENNYYVNKNKTLWEYEGGDGVKTGYTTSSGRCLVSSAKRDNMRLIAVSLRASDWFNDNYKLMDYGFTNFKLYNVYGKNQLITLATVVNGVKEKVPLVSNNEFQYPLTEEEKDKIKLSIEINENINAPILQGDILGSLNVFFDGKLIREDKLVAKYDIDKKSFINRFLDDIKSMSN